MVRRAGGTGGNVPIQKVGESLLDEVCNPDTENASDSPGKNWKAHMDPLVPHPQKSPKSRATGEDTDPAQEDQAKMAPKKEVDLPAENVKMKKERLSEFLILRGT